MLYPNYFMADTEQVLHGKIKIWVVRLRSNTWTSLAMPVKSHIVFILWWHCRKVAVWYLTTFTFRAGWWVPCWLIKAGSWCLTCCSVDTSQPATLTACEIYCCTTCRRPCVCHQVVHMSTWSITLFDCKKYMHCILIHPLQPAFLLTTMLQFGACT